GELELRHATRGKEGCERRDIRRFTGSRHNHRTGALASACIGYTNDRHLGNLRMLEQHVFDLLGRDVLAVADDDVLAASGHDQIVTIHPPTDVAAAVITVFVERGLLVLRMQVADRHLRSADADLALAVARGGLSGWNESHGGDAGATVGIGGMIKITAV